MYWERLWFRQTELPRRIRPATMWLRLKAVRRPQCQQNLLSLRAFGSRSRHPRGAERKKLVRQNGRLSPRASGFRSHRTAQSEIALRSEHVLADLFAERLRIGKA